MLTVKQRETPVSLIQAKLKQARERQRMAFEWADRVNFENQLVLITTLEMLLTEIGAFCGDYE